VFHEATVRGEGRAVDLISVPGKSFPELQGKRDDEEVRRRERSKVLRVHHHRQDEVRKRKRKNYEVLPTPKHRLGPTQDMRSLGKPT
jgi:hypothetical protein